MQFKRLINCLVLLASLLMAGMPGRALAQFSELTSMPWCPPHPSFSPDTQAKTDILGQLSAALQSGQYREVVELYPQAISQGYQRNADLFNQTRRALRNLMQQEGGEIYWPQMQNLYHDRFTYIGQEEYEYRNTLETKSWSEQQLQNEQVLGLVKKEGQYNASFAAVRQILRQNQGQGDPVLVLQGMFVPLNREHAAHPERGSEYLANYQEILNWLESTESYMKSEHLQAWQGYYKQQTLDQVREECNRVLTADADLMAYRHRMEEQEKLNRAYNDSVNAEVRALRLYEEAHNAYNKRAYNEAYDKVNQSLAVYDTKNAHVLKCAILQGAANASTEMADKVAFWCAAYEAGQGYADKKTLNQLVSALKSHLFMTGLAGKVHSTRKPIQIRQRIWTVAQLREY